jgi:hypothetical protein
MDVRAGPTCGTFHQIGHPAVSLSPRAARHCSSRRRQHELVSLSQRGQNSSLPPRLHFRSSPHCASTPLHPVTTTLYNNPTKSLLYQHSRSFWNPLDQFGPRYLHPRFPTNSNATVVMLRRPATTIQLTVADVEQYEANRQRKLWEQQQTQQQPSSQSTIASETTKDQTQSVPMKSRKDRIMGGNGRAN